MIGNNADAQEICNQSFAITKMLEDKASSKY